jgi:hypothetical protein
LPELAALDPVAGLKPDVDNLLREAWPRHHAAVTELIFHLPLRQRNGLEAAWREYYEVGGSIRFYDYSMGETGNPRDGFRQRVNAILSFTNI